MPKFRESKDKRPGVPDFFFKCDGCGFEHGVWTDPAKNGANPLWEFNGNVFFPTLNPSVLVTWPSKGGNRVCHSFIREGNIQYLGDCTHDLANRTVPLKDY